MTGASSPTQGHSLDRPSEWVVRWAHRIKAQGAVLDLACGSRHLRVVAYEDLEVTAPKPARIQRICVLGLSGEA